jgi:hypothetical protein
MPAGNPEAYGFQGLQSLNGLVRAERASTAVDTPREVVTRRGLEQAAREEFARRRQTAGFPTAISMDPDFTGAGQMPRQQAEGVLGTIKDFSPVADIEDIVHAVQDPTPLNVGVAGLAALGPVGDAAKKALRARKVVPNKAERKAAAEMTETELQQIVVGKGPSSRLGLMRVRPRPMATKMRAVDSVPAGEWAAGQYDPYHGLGLGGDVGRIEMRRDVLRSASKEGKTSTIRHEEGHAMWDYLPDPDRERLREVAGAVEGAGRVGGMGGSHWRWLKGHLKEETSFGHPMADNAQELWADVWKTAVTGQDLAGYAEIFGDEFLGMVKRAIVNNKKGLTNMPIADAEAWADFKKTSAPKQVRQ